MNVLTRRTLVFCLLIASQTALPGFARPDATAPALTGAEIAFSELADHQVSASRVPAAAALPDKLLHGLAGASSALFGSAAACACTGEADPRKAARTVAAAGLGAAALVGLTKELLDLGGLGNPELLDLVCTVLGGLAVSAGVYALLLEQSAAGADTARLSVPLVSFGLVLAFPVADSWIKKNIKNSGTCRGENTTQCVLPYTSFPD